MTSSNNLIHVFSGTEVAVLILKGKLEDAGISAHIQNDYQSGITAGFGGGVPSAIDLFIQETDLPQAESIIQEHLLANQ
ncbi:MAG: DUF2007 domain-containing protein [Marinilabiliaceae bacterium]|nr:DUF2007 domain-containing protein [Marinilabiliaceae bacterium]